MSEDNMSNMSVCAFCGIAEVDEVNLKECTSCDLVRYCSDACKQDHKSQHKEACKKRAAKLRDELLFKQPDGTHIGDCPICMLPLSLDPKKSIIRSCCSKLICKGCHYANRMREEKERLKKSCPFCRVPIPSTKEECHKQRMKRVEANDPVAMRQWGVEQAQRGDYSSAFRYFTKAAELGDVEAHHQISNLYHHGRGVEKDEEKSIHHTELAAIGGHPTARCNLAFHEERNGKMKRGVRHLIIAATQGSDESIKSLMFAFKKGCVGKEVLAAALRAHQAAVEETKSPQREAAD